MCAKHDASIELVIKSIECVLDDGDASKAKNILIPAISLLYKKIEKLNPAPHRELTVGQSRQI